MIILIDDKLISELYVKYDRTDDGRDSWEVAADIINELVTREDYPADSDYFYQIYSIFDMVNTYVQINSRKN